MKSSRSFADPIRTLQYTRRRLRSPVRHPEVLERFADIKRRKPTSFEMGSHNSGGVLLSHRAAPAVPSALIGFLPLFQVSEVRA